MLVPKAQFDVASPTDLPAIRRLLASVFQVADTWPAFRADLLTWKAFDPHPFWEGARSYVMRSGEDIVAHGCIMPIEVMTLQSGIVRAGCIVDWVSHKDHPGAGATVYSGILKLSEAILGIGGSGDARRILPRMGFKQPQSIALFERVTKPVARLIETGTGSWKWPARVARDYAYRFRPAHTPAGEWSARQVTQFDSSVESVLPKSGTLQVCRRSIDFLNYVLKCPIDGMNGYLIERGSEIAGYAILSRNGKRARIADIWTPSQNQQDWNAAYALASALAAGLSSVTSILASSSSPVASAALEACSFRFVQDDPVFLKDPKAKIPAEPRMNIGLMDNDAFFNL